MKKFFVLAVGATVALGAVTQTGASAHAPRPCTRALATADDMLDLDERIEQIVYDISDLEIDSRNKALNAGQAALEGDDFAFDDATAVIEANDAEIEGMWTDHDELIDEWNALLDRYERDANKCRDS